MNAPLYLHINSDSKAAFTYCRTGMIDTGWHQHTEHQLIYAEGGVLSVFTTTAQFLLPAYHGAWVPAHCQHKLISPAKETKLWLLYFRPQEAEPSVLHSVRIFGISPLAREMLLYSERWSEAAEPAEGSDPLEHHFYETIRHLVPEWCEQPLSLVLPYTDEEPLKTIIQHLLANLDADLKIKTIAYHYGLSGRTLMRLFQRQFGITFGTYLRIARIVKAVELLTSPNVSVLEVAYAVGYKSPSSFSQAFRTLTGLTPQAYGAKRLSERR
ncbi:MAG: helix-turn-helix transcriptional regulator [Chloroflexota bacterium]